MTSVLGACATAAEPDPPLEEHQGFKGVWLRNDAAEAFVSVEPYIRLLAFHRIGGEPWLAVGPKPHNQGMRTWFMEPTQNKLSPRPGDRPGEVVQRLPYGVRVLGNVDEQSQLQVGMDVRLDPQEPVLHVTHVLENASDRERRVSVWPIIALPRDGQEGRIVIPYRQSKTQPFAQLITYLKMPGVGAAWYVYGQHAVVHDLSLPRDTGTKLGVHSPPGWVALVRGADVLLSSTPYEPDATYPEGGGNITTFANEDGPGFPWAEMEHTSPLTDLAPGERVTLDQTLRLLQLPESPAVDATPDELYEAIDAVR